MMLFALIPFAVGIILFVVVGLGLSGLFQLGFIAKLVITLVGITLWGVAGWAALYKKFYIIAGPNEAIIRTGKGGKSTKTAKKKAEPIEGETATFVPEKPIVAIGTGMWSIPLFHKSKILKLQQYVFPIDKTGENALLCKDSILADVSGTFKLTVQRDPEAILKYLDAAGERDINSEKTMQTLCFDTLETSLRDACTSKEYQEVFEGREKVGDEIERSVENDFSKIGVILSVAKLTDVDPAPKNSYREGNLQHAVGLTKIVKITEDERRDQEIKKLTISREIKDQEVTTAREILTLEQSEEFAIAEQKREIDVKKAEEDNTSRQAIIATEEEVQKRDISKDKAVEIDQVAKDKAVETQKVEKRQTVEKAEVKKKETLEVAEQEREVAVAKKETELAKAEEEKNTAEAAQEKAAQSIVDAREIMTADRDKKKEVIAQEAISEKELIKAQKTAEAEAYGVERKAKADETAASAAYVAKVKGAEATQIEKEKSAAGLKAEQMVPIEVAAKQVEVDKDRVENVLTPELEVKAKFDKVSIDLTLGQLKIEAVKDVGIANANAFGEALSAADMTIFGDPKTLSDMTDKFKAGQGITQLLDGVMSGNGNGSGDIIKGAGAVLTGLMKKLGMDIDPSILEDAIKKKTGASETKEETAAK